MTWRGAKPHRNRNERSSEGGRATRGCLQIEKWCRKSMIVDFEGMTPRIHPTAWIAPNAVVIGNVEVGKEASIWYGVVVRGDNRDHVIRIGARTNIQDNAVIHVSSRGPTIIGEEVTVGHGAIIESCVIGRRSLIGMNAVVLQEAVIGEEARVAAGSVVSGGAEVPARYLVAGAPAKLKKRIDEESLRSTTKTATHYVALSRRHKANEAANAARDGRSAAEPLHG